MAKSNACNVLATDLCASKSALNNFKKKFNRPLLVFVLSKNSYVSHKGAERQHGSQQGPEGLHQAPFVLHHNDHHQDTINNKEYAMRHSHKKGRFGDAANVLERHAYTQKYKIADAFQKAGNTQSVDMGS